ncbi:hypothetical protein [Aurantiacibacter suaedae]|uniref:hypothetical protein n=1 Tax=Aurantiacibacter suaedae TaxID=2545755 RepID=UPI0010F8171A|nr:hypothetical protein [Aurantiacibacter suaedae]
MSEPIIRIHLGSHKTATTYLQETLLLNSERSAAAGLAYLPLSVVRPPLRDAIQARRKRQKQKGYRLFSKGAVDARAKMDEIAWWFDIDMPVTLSEENILGEAQDSYGGGIYPNAAIGLSVLRDTLPQRPLEFFLAIRSYASYLASMYAESLRHGGFIPLEKYLKFNRLSPGSWVTLVDTIRKTFPEARIVTWRYEDFSALEPQILERLSGVPFAQMHRLSQSVVLPSASSEAIEEMIAMAPDLSPQQRVYTMLALQDRYLRSDKSQRFLPWSDQDKAAMSERYDRDVEQLKARSDVEVLG